MPERTFDYYTLRHTLHGEIAVMGWDTYPDSSVLAGQARKTNLGYFPDEAAARAAYPQAGGFSNKYTEPQVSLAHLPGEDDPVAGGMYPDDIDG